MMFDFPHPFGRPRRPVAPEAHRGRIDEGLEPGGLIWGSRTLAEGATNPGKRRPAVRGSSSIKRKSPYKPSQLRTRTLNAPSRAVLEGFPNPSPHRDYMIRMQIRSSPACAREPGSRTFRDAFSRLRAGPQCVELKSLKLYIGSFRNEGAFHEAVTNRICDDLVKLLSRGSAPDRPIFCPRGMFYQRGGREDRRKAGTRSRLGACSDRRAEEHVVKGPAP